jgi:hypothetical protein
LIWTIRWKGTFFLAFGYATIRIGGRRKWVGKRVSDCINGFLQQHLSLKIPTKIDFLFDL